MYKYSIIVLAFLVMSAACTQVDTDEVTNVDEAEIVEESQGIEIVDEEIDVAADIEDYSHLMSSYDDGPVLEIIKKSVDGDVHLFLSKDGEEKFIREVNETFDREPEAERLIEAYITFDNKYLIYEVMGYEWMMVFIYDIAAEEEVYSNWGGNYGFTYDGRYFYQCKGVGHLEGYMKVYTLPSFSLYKDLNYGQVASCFEYNSVDNSFVYEISYDSYETGVTKTYYFDTGVVE